MTSQDLRTHEVTFCSRVAKWSEAVFTAGRDIPFQRVEIEEAKGIRRKRSDLRVYDRQNNLILAGEVKLPGTPAGRNPYDYGLVEDAFRKADNAGARYFFTWNVNCLVLFDRSLWHRPLFERRVREWDLGLNLETPDAVSRPEVETAIQKFLAEFYTELAAIATGQKLDWGMPPDEYFIRAFERHIAWPVKLTAEFLLREASRDKGFDVRLQEWMAREQSWLVSRNDPDAWRNLVDRAARTLAYVFSNRLIFYESIRAKFADLPALSIPRNATGRNLYLHFQKRFQQAVDATGDYETLFYPLEMEKEWAGPLIFQHADAHEAWASVLENIQPFNFKLIPSDILGGIFKRLISPEERYKFGQHYTDQDLVDVVNAFCIRRGTDNVLDPACGSGSFLVRAYQRKAWLDNSQSHQELLAQIYGVDIALFAAHLATLNLAARDVREEENYPRIARRNFFEVAPDQPFCRIPAGLQGERRMEEVTLPPLDAVVGNPPYVRQEMIPRRNQKGVKPFQSKEDIHDLCRQAWPDLVLSGRSDLHCYFWPAATRFLKEGGWFGFLVSSSWLDVDYGFALQGWILRHFKLHAIIESTCEPWFEDARIKTCAVILQRCADEKERMAQLVKFVRVDRPLAEILGQRSDENSRQRSAEKFRDAISRAKTDITTDAYRIIVKRQSELWEEGLRVGQLFARKQGHRANVVREPAASYEVAAQPELPNGNDDNDDENGDSEDPPVEVSAGGYGGGKWGKYLRAPEIYFRIMREYRDKFVPLGEIAEIRRGVTSGCDAFFMPRDVSAEVLRDYSAKNWRDVPILTYCKRSEVESGKVKLVMDGEGVVHPIESRYLAPEVHSLMNVSRPIIRANECERLILLVSEPLSKLRGTYVHRYLRYGETHAYASRKSKAVPVAKRSTCAGRDPWYDLTGFQPGYFFWPMAQQYRHIIPVNPDKLACNHNLFDVHPSDLTAEQMACLAAIVNSTLVGLFKTFYGRYAGTEGNLKTEVVDVNLLEVPDPRGVSAAVAKKLRDAFEKLCQRDTGPLVEQEFMDCHSAERARKLAEKPIGLPEELKRPDRRALDLAVLELLGVDNKAQREQLCDELYRATAAHFRAIRVVEIQKQEQRGRTEGREFQADELAKDIWDGLDATEKVPVAQWYREQVLEPLPVTIPEGEPTLADATDLVVAQTVFFKHGSRQKQKASFAKLDFPSRAHAELAHLLARTGLHGPLELPRKPADAARLCEELRGRLATVHARADHLARSRTSDDRRIEEIAALLQNWMLHGKPS